MKIDFCTFCHPGDIHRLYHDTWLTDMIASHSFHFDTVRIVHQRLGSSNIELLYDTPNIKTVNANGLHIIPSEMHPNILTEFGLPEDDPVAEQYTHGPNAPHYYKHHLTNHLTCLKVSDADYIVFSDSDCTIKSQNPDKSWIEYGIEILEKYSEVLIISPGDGATMHEARTEEGYRLTQNVSQQLFLCNRERLKGIDFNIPWNWEMLAPGGPFQEYYFLLEGRIWRYMHKYGLWRCILPDEIVRYWHHNVLTEDGYFEKDYGKY